MLGHLGINVNNLRAAKSYYDALMPLMGSEELLSSDNNFAYQPAGDKRSTFLFFYPASEPVPFSRYAPGLQHPAFMVPTCTAVRDVYAEALELGGTSVHIPPEFPQ